MAFSVLPLGSGSGAEKFELSDEDSNTGAKEFFVLAFSVGFLDEDSTNSTFVLTSSGLQKMLIYSFGMVSSRASLTCSVSGGESKMFGRIEDSTISLFVCAVSSGQQKTLLVSCPTLGATVARCGFRLNYFGVMAG